MPTIARFYGIIVQMRLIDKEHNPPHIHAKYNDYEASFLISTGEIVEGNFPSKARQLVKEFILKHQIELLEMWNTQVFRKLPPLE